MKKIFCVIFGLAAMTACSQESGIGSDFESSNLISATATDFAFNGTTRTSITQTGGDAPAFAWKDGDVIGVIPLNGKTVQSNYEIAEIGTDPKQAMFDGGVWALREGKEYAAYYPYQYEAIPSGGSLSFSFLGQTQSANNSLEHIGAYDYMYASAVVPQGGNVQFNFKHLISLVRLQITVPSADTFTRLVLESTESWFANTSELSLSDGSMTVKEPSKSAFINLNDITVDDHNILTVWFATLPTKVLESKTLALKLFGNNGTVTGELTGLTSFEAGKSYSFACTASTESSVEYVDLGLSVKWATCNLGANAPEEYGDYYAWGDIETYYEDGYAQESPQKHWKNGKSGGYSENNYKFYQREIAETDIYDNDGFLIAKAGSVVAGGYTKYVLKSYADRWGFKGFYDGKTVLDIEDDVAHIKLGGKWRMPTSSEINELINNCTWTWASYKGVNGYKVTSKKDGYTDKWIFLPAACERDDTSLRNVGSYGYYWSSSLDANYPYYANRLYFDSSDVSRFSSHRYYGLSVRPVYDVKIGGAENPSIGGDWDWN